MRSNVRTVSAVLMDISQYLHKNRRSKSHVWSQDKGLHAHPHEQPNWHFWGKTTVTDNIYKVFPEGESDLYTAIFWPLCNPVYLLQTCEYQCFKRAFHFPWEFTRNTATGTFVPAWGWGMHGSPSEGDLNQPGCCSAEPNSTDRPPRAHRCCLSTTWPRDARLSWKNWALARSICWWGEDLEASLKNRMLAKWRRLTQRQWR